MKFTFLGTGSAHTVGPDNFQSNMLLENSEGKRLMIDCGSDARNALYQLGLSYQDIDSIYISHLHADHTGGLEWIALTRKFDTSMGKPRLFISKQLVQPLWENVLSGVLNTLEGVKADLSTFFDVYAIEENSSFIWSGVEFQLVQTIHVMSGFCLVPSYGLLFKVNNKTLFITTDTQLAPYQIHDFYQMADLIFHDCETKKNPSRVHAHFTELAHLPLELKRKMWLYHYDSGDLPDAVKSGFRGFAQKGQCFNLSDPNIFN
jgi:ribonuclease BN (tRNA processing enzyme)